MESEPPILDNQILQAVRENGAEGWELFCDQFDPLIRSITSWSKWNFSEDEQQDVLQNIYVELQTALLHFRQECSLKWFIKRIAMCQCVNEIRRQVRWRTLTTPSVQKDCSGEWCELDFNASDDADPYREISKQEQLQALAKSLALLQHPCKTSINLFYVRDLSYREMSKQLGISVNTVGSRLSKCLRKLHKELMRNPLFERSSK